MFVVVCIHCIAFFSFLLPFLLVGSVGWVGLSMSLWPPADFTQWPATRIGALVFMGIVWVLAVVAWFVPRKLYSSSTDPNSIKGVCLVGVRMSVVQIAMKDEGREAPPQQLWRMMIRGLHLVGPCVDHLFP